MGADAEAYAEVRLFVLCMGIGTLTSSATIGLFVGEDVNLPALVLCLGIGTLTCSATIGYGDRNSHVFRYDRVWGSELSRVPLRSGMGIGTLTCSATIGYGDRNSHVFRYDRVWGSELSRVPLRLGFFASSATSDVLHFSHTRGICLAARELIEIL